MKKNTRLLIICLLIPLAVGVISALISRGAMDTFNTLEKPPLSPPAWLFPVVWTVLYLLMGYSLYLVLKARSDTMTLNRALYLFFLQLFFNFFWPIFFFNFSLYIFSFGWLVVMWGLILAMILTFLKISRRAALVNLPYLIWVAFAGYLNLGIAILNV